ncbi:MAG: GNAT family N-acetyltransferase, partial [bacterium]
DAADWRSLRALGLAVTRLDGTQSVRVAEFCRQCRAFFELVTGEEDAAISARGLLEDGPPGVTDDRRYLLGIERANELVGVVGLIDGFPAATDWYVGIFLLLPEERNRGNGRAIWTAMEAYVRSRGGHVIRLIVQDQNVGAVRFWQSVGFVTHGQVQQQLANRANLCWRFERTLESGSS